MSADLCKYGMAGATKKIFSGKINFAEPDVKTAPGNNI